MVKKILAVNISHDSSVAYFENGILKEYFEESRFTKIKSFAPPNPFYKDPYDYQMLEKYKNVVFDAVVIVSSDKGDILIEKPYVDNVLRQLNFKQFKFYYNEHHMFHVLSGFYFSEFDEAIGITCDGGGERYRKTLATVESIYTINKKEIIPHYKSVTSMRFDYFKNLKDIDYLIHDNFDIRITNKEIGGLKFCEATAAAGFDLFQEGQLMGIAAYINKNTNLDKKVLSIAHKAQEETLQERIELIEKAQKYSSCKNIILSGGYHLNCSNNFKLVKHFPHLNFFVDPIPYDGGTAVGAAHFYESY
tara:strand:+ start:534 stop:1448 length:915 start_codon:yes stop_codon:yes gene_type:complete